MGNTYVSSAFVAKYTPDSGLTPNWVQTIGGNVTPGAGGMAADANTNSLYLPGSFSGTVDFQRDGVSTVTDTLTSVAGDWDVFVAKYNLLTGDLAWVRGVGGPGRR